MSSDKIWPRLRIGEFAKTCSGATPSRSMEKYYEGVIPWVKTGELRDGEIHDTEEHVSELALKETSLRLLPAGTLLVAMYGQGQTRGRTGLLMRAATTNQACFAILPNPERYDTAYLQWWFRHNYHRLRSETESRGGNQPNLNGIFLRKQEVELPPLAEQKRIAGILKEQLAAVERARAAAKAQLEAATALSAAYLRDVFQGEESKGWRPCRLGELMDRFNVVVHPGDRHDGVATFVGLEHVEPNTGKRIGSLKIDLANLTGRKPTFKKGQIVYGYLRPYLNKVWIADFDGCSSVDQFAFDVRHDRADTRFIAAFMRSDTFLRRSAVVTTTGQLPRISIDEILAVQVDLPATIQEQTRIADEIAVRKQGTEQLVERCDGQLKDIEVMPAALLRAAFQGSL